jgi:signal peptidase II
MKSAHKGAMMLLKNLSMIFSLCTIDLAFKDNILYIKNNNYPIRVSQKLNLTNVQNRGFALNVLEDKPLVKYLPIVLTIFLFFRLCKLSLKRQRALERFGLILVIAGSLSNIYDRLKRGYVVDYIHVNLPIMKEVIFNLADVYILAGSISASLAALFIKKRGKR